MYRHPSRNQLFAGYSYSYCGAALLLRGQAGPGTICDGEPPRAVPCTGLPGVRGPAAGQGSHAGGSHCCDRKGNGAAGSIQMGTARTWLRNEYW